MLERVSAPSQEAWNKAYQNTPRFCSGNELLLPAAGPTRRLQVGVPGGFGVGGGPMGVAGVEGGGVRAILNGPVVVAGDGVLFENMPPKAWRSAGHVRTAPFIYY